MVQSFDEGTFHQSHPHQYCPEHSLKINLENKTFFMLKFILKNLKINEKNQLKLREK